MLVQDPLNTTLTRPETGAVPVSIKTRLLWRRSLADFGVAGNNTADDTAKIQSAFDAIPEYGMLDIPAGLKLRITGTLNLHARKGIQIAGMGSPGSGTSAGDAVTSFIWDGAANGTMISIDNLRDSTFSNFSMVNYHQK